MSLNSYYKFISNNPWYECWRSAHRRCKDRKHKNFKSHGAKGIKCFLTKEDAKFLWDRDKGHLLSIPSIDRIDGNKDYTIDNCRFIEYYENCRLAAEKRHGREVKIKDNEEAVSNWGG